VQAVGLALNLEWRCHQRSRAWKSVRNPQSSLEI